MEELRKQRIGNNVPYSDENICIKTEIDETELEILEAYSLADDQSLNFSFIQADISASKGFASGTHMVFINENGQEELDFLLDQPDQQTKKNGITPLTKTFTKWTEKEINYLKKGHEKFGDDWRSILDYYNFNPGRTFRALRKKFGRIKEATVADNSLVKKTMWTEKELANLWRGFNKYGPKWAAISKNYKFHPCRSVHALEAKFRKISPESFQKKKNERGYHIWTEEEENNLREGFNRYGSNWKKVLEKYPFHPSRTRTVLQSKFLRMMRGKIEKGSYRWTNKEIGNLWKGYNWYGPKWDKISKEFPFHPSRNANSIKKKYFLLKKMLQVQENNVN